MVVETRDIVIPVIIGLMVNLVTAYLFSLGWINQGVLLLIIAGSLLFVVILGIQLRTNKIEKEQRKYRMEQEKLNERLKIYDELINMKSDIKELQRRIK